MLEELDQVTARVNLLIQLTEQLATERDQLKNKLADTQAQLKSLQDNFNEHQEKLTQIEQEQEVNLAEASQFKAQLSTENKSLKDELSALQEQFSLQNKTLEASQKRVLALKQGTQDAREKVAYVLNNLPNSGTGEQV